MTARCGMLIDGRWVGATGRSVIEVIDPATEDVVGTVPGGDTRRPRRCP